MRLLLLLVLSECSGVLLLHVPSLPLLPSHLPFFIPRVRDLLPYLLCCECDAVCVEHVPCCIAHDLVLRRPSREGLSVVSDEGEEKEEVIRRDVDIAGC